MTTPKLVFVHGWGCGPDVWEPMLSALDLPSACVLDLGYFGAPQNEAQMRLEALRQGPQPVLAVGHSLGFLWLLSRGDWPEGSAFLGINAFGRFAGAEDFPKGVPVRVLARMRAGLQRDAAQVVTHFRARCGLGAVAEEALCVSALQDGLTELMTLDARPLLGRLAKQAQAVKILAGTQDPIVSQQMTISSMPPDFPIEWQAEGGHMLPLTDSHICAEAVRHMMSHMQEKS